MAPPGTKIIASNRRARHDYAISDSIEAGISLLGSEVKSLREAQVQLNDGFARFRSGELWLEGVAIAPYGFAVGFGATSRTALENCCCIEPNSNASATR